MTTRAVFTAAQLARAVKVAESLGKVAVQTPIGIAFVDPATVGKVGPRESVSPVDAWFAENGDAGGEGD